jgi:hypothetical protein
MKFYLRGWQFWGKLFNMKQGAAQFCRKPVFEQLKGYEETVFMGEDVMLAFVEICHAEKRSSLIE